MLTPTTNTRKRIAAVLTSAALLLMGTGSLAAQAAEDPAAPEEAAIVALEEAPAEEAVPEAPAEEAATEPAVEAEPAVEEPAAEEPAEEPVAEEPAPVEPVNAEQPAVEAPAEEPASAPEVDEALVVAEEPPAEEPERGVLADVSLLAVDTTFWPYDYQTITDLSGTDQDTVFVQGSKENDLSSWTQGSASPTTGGDIVNGYVGAEMVDGRPMLYVGLDRLDAGGNNGYFLELNKLPNTTNGNGAIIPNRTDGDLRFVFPSGQNFSYPTAQVWQNGAWVDANILGMQFQSDEFTAEFKVDVAKLLSIDIGDFECNDLGFNSFYLRTGASSNDQSQLKDYVTGAIDIDFCAEMTIKKVDEDGNALAGATFTIDPNPLVGATESPLTIVDNDANDMDKADGIIRLPEINPGTYTVTETVAPEGYLLPAERSQTLKVEAEGAITYTFTDPMIWEAPTATKTVTATYDALYKWSIDKLANGEDGITEMIRAGESYDLDYDVVVEYLGSELSNFALAGEITVENPNAKPMDVTLSDVLNGNLACTITGGADVTLDPGTNTFGYVCAADANTPRTGTNTASLVYGNADHPSTQAHVDDPATAGTTTVNTDEVPYTFEQTATDNPVTVTDQFTGEDPVALGTITVNPDGTLSVAAEGAFVIDGNTVTFDGGSRTIKPEPGSCEALTNTATVVDLTDTVEVEICADADLEIAKTVAGSYGKTHDWSIDKSVDPDAPINLVGDETQATVEYSVVVTYEGYELNVSVVSGTITVTNPNDWAKDYTVTDTFEGTECVVTDATGTIPANDSVELAYECTMPASFEPGDDDTNVAKVTFTVADVEATEETDPVTIDWQKTELHATVDVYDFFDGDVEGEPLGSLDGNAMQDGDTKAYTYERTLDGAAGKCVKYDNTAKVVDDDTVLDEDDATVDICQENELVVTKTAEGSYDLTHLWLIDKSVDPTKTEVTGTEATLAYDVVVTYDGFATSDHVLTGTITVENDNAWARTFTAEDVFDGETCDVADAPRTVPAYGTVTLEYTCDLDDDDDFTPGDDDVNKVTVKAENLKGDTDSVMAEADVDWVVTEFQNPVTVTDEFRDEAAAELGTITVGTDVTEKGDTVTYSYEKTVELESGECLTVRNVAKVIDGDDVIVEDDADSELCAEADLVVTKTAEATATVQYLWDIEKNAVKTDLGVLKPGQTVWAEYVVTVTPDGYEITEAALDGTFTITNPNAYKAVEVDITDVVSDGAWECTYDGDAVTIEAGETKVLTYTCALGDDDDDEWLEGEGTNTVTVSWTNADGEESSVEHTVGYALDVTEVDKVITVKDKFADRAETLLGTVEWSEDEVAEFTYRTGMVIGKTPGKFRVNNVAWIVETGQEDDEKVTFEVPKPPKKPGKPGLPKTGVSFTPTAPAGTALAVRREEDER